MCSSPVVVAPAMHTEMWEHPGVQRSVELLTTDGVAFVGPDTGDLASGDHGAGRLSEPAAIVDAVGAALGPRDLTGVHVLVTAGPTREPIDPVRYLSNRSSGKMGYALAAAAARRGASVTLVSGPTSLSAPRGVELVLVSSAQEMLDECLSRFDDVDVVVKAAAVADRRPAEPSDTKRRKEELGAGLRLEPTPDIAAELGRKKGRQILVLFAAETTDVVGSAREKLARKNADVVVANLVGREGTGFDSDTNEASIVTADGVDDLPRLPKSELAERIWDHVSSRVGKPPSS
jgi:phosphopantothenoylcysteine decarboxylase/phosphopantothenate--cysteine ligase